MKSILLLFASLLVSLSVAAVPAKRIKRVITLSDGSKIEAVFRGDENVHFFEAEDGSRYQEMSDGCYAKVRNSVIDSMWNEKLCARNRLRSERYSSFRASMNVGDRNFKDGLHKATWGATSNPISGKRKGLVILAQFPNKKFRSKHDNAFFQRFFNEEGFSENNMGGSVHDFFLESSYGKFDLTFDVVGPVNVSKNYDYYGKNDSNGDDVAACEFVSEAVHLAIEQGLDFSDYDWDNDGYVDQVFIVFAGYSEAAGAASNTLWPHEWELSAGKYYGDGDGPIIVGDKIVDTYAISSELTGISGSVIDGIGTACHEFSHCLGLPDFYDVYGDNFGMDMWDLLDYGCYAGENMSGECPIGYTSYERMYCGWLQPKELEDYTEVSALHCLKDSADAYIIYNKKYKNEYYLLENRQLDGFFRYGYGHGMLVLHVDFDKNSWIDNSVNGTASHQRMTIIPADNSCKSSPYYSTNYVGDTYPGSKKNTSLTDTSKPAATLYNKNSDGRKYMGYPIRDIAESADGIISFVAGERQESSIENVGSEDVKDRSASNVLYDLQGRRVSPAYRGITVSNGKKIMGLCN